MKIHPTNVFFIPGFEYTNNGPKRTTVILKTTETGAVIINPLYWTPEKPDEYRVTPLLTSKGKIIDILKLLSDDTPRTLMEIYKSDIPLSYDTIRQYIRELLWGNIIFKISDTPEKLWANCGNTDAPFIGGKPKYVISEVGKEILKKRENI